MIGRAIGTRLARRFSRGIPVVELVMLARVAMLAGEHVRRLEPAERKRLVALVRKAHGRPSTLDEAEHAELDALVAKLEPRLLAGSAVEKLSPLPLPKRLLYGAKDSPARAALRERERR